MANERKFTGEDREWLKENYPHLSNKACLKHFNCGYESLKKLVAECGLNYKGSSHENTKYVCKKEKKYLWKDEGTKGEMH